MLSAQPRPPLDESEAHRARNAPDSPDRRRHSDRGRRRIGVCRGRSVGTRCTRARPPAAEARCPLSPCCRWCRRSSWSRTRRPRPKATWHVFSGSVTDGEGAALANITVSVFCQELPGRIDFLSVAESGPALAGEVGIGRTAIGGDYDRRVGRLVGHRRRASVGLAAGRGVGSCSRPTRSERSRRGSVTSRSDLSASLADGGRLSGRILADGAPPPSSPTSSWEAMATTCSGRA